MAHGKDTWMAAKEWYTQGDVAADGSSRRYPSLGEVAKKFGVGETHLRRMSGSEKWLDARAMFEQKLADARQQKRIQALAGRAAEFDGTALVIAEDIMRELNTRLNPIVVAPGTNKGNLPPLTVQDLARMAGALSAVHKAGRLAMGDTTEHEKLSTNLSPEWDLGAFSEAELAQLEALQRKALGSMPINPGLPAPAATRH